jgi:hypothetical protein
VGRLADAGCRVQQLLPRLDKFTVEIKGGGKERRKETEN